MSTVNSSSLLLFVLCLVPGVALAQRYTVRDLGPLAPTGINSWAQVVGNYNGHAYIWTKWDGLRDLGLLPGGTFSQAAAINDRGAVTGTADGVGTVVSLYPEIVPTQQCSDLTQPFVWTSTTGMHGLGTVAWNFVVGDNCQYPFYGRSINDFANVVGDMPFGPNLYAFGFISTSTSGMSLFGSSYPQTFANSISNSGEIVGQNSVLTNIGAGHATVWQNSISADLGTLAGGIAEYGSSANGVNDLGLIVGWSTTSPVLIWDPPSPVHAIFWAPNRGMSDLGTLPGDTSSAAIKINFFGQVIGTSGNTLYANNDASSAPFEVIGRPFIWSERRGMRDLNALIPQNSGWVLNSATDINAWGQIVGLGTRNGQSHGYLLTPLNPFQGF